MLPEGEHKFVITGGESYTSDAGNEVWKFSLETEFNGQTVRRTHRVTMGLDFSEDLLCGLLDAVGSDPTKEDIYNHVKQGNYEPKHFKGKEFCAMVRHKEYRGKTQDEIAYPIPGFYRTKWEESQKKKAAPAPQPANPAPENNEVNDDELPF